MSVKAGDFFQCKQSLAVCLCHLSEYSRPEKILYVLRMLNPLEIDVVEPRTLCPIFSFLQPKAPKTPNVHAVDKVDQP